MTQNNNNNDNHDNNRRLTQSCPLVCACLFKRVTMAFVARDCGTSAVRRRRERRLRSMLRHERMTVRNGPCRGDPPLSSKETDDGKGQGRGERDEQRFWPEDSSTQGGKHDVLQDGRRRDVLAARPTPPAEVRPLPGVQRHTAAHIEDIVPYVQILDVPVPQLEDRVVDLLREIDAPALVEQVIAVPKISLDRVLQRSVCRRSRRAEQLVEVPTIVSYYSLQQQTIICIVQHSWRARR